LYPRLTSVFSLHLPLPPFHIFLFFHFSILIFTYSPQKTFTNIPPPTPDRDGDKYFFLAKGLLLETLAPAHLDREEEFQYLQPGRLGSLAHLATGCFTTVLVLVSYHVQYITYEKTGHSAENVHGFDVLPPHAVLVQHLSF
jgi:hypothetical protein